MIGRGLFASEPIGNLFYLHAVIFEIPKQYFIIKPPACWGADVSIEIYELLLLLSIITPWLNKFWQLPINNIVRSFIFQNHKNNIIIFWVKINVFRRCQLDVLCKNRLQKFKRTAFKKTLDECFCKILTFFFYSGREPQ